MKKDGERLDKTLVARGLVKSRARAKALVEGGSVTVGAKVMTDPAFFVSLDAAIVLGIPDFSWVSRGAKKLLGAFEEWDLDVVGKVALDVGSSTGGFTEVLLANGAARVYALDVGHDQLDAKLREDKRVVVMEGKHILDATPGDFAEPITVAVVDLSFISLTKIVSKINNLIVPGGELVALVKPQFEVGKGNLDKGGIVRDPVLREEALRRVVCAAKDTGFTVLGTMDSPIEGGDGNREYFLYCVRA